MWNVHFNGYFQCRLATDPDDFEDPRGQAGWTFAFDGEPDLDRVIRFHDPVGPRSFAPPIGVTVVDVNGARGHALAGARVTLLENPKFEGRNGLVAPAGREPIAPLVVEVRKDGFVLMRRDDYVVTNPVDRRPHMGQGVAELTAAEADALGVSDAAAFRNGRLDKLETALQTEPDPIKRTNLLARIDQLRNFSSAGDIQNFSLGFKVPYSHQLRHAGSLSDPAGLLPGVNFAVPWEMTYWMGAWDADALQAFVDGRIMIATV
jgi:hypothetical protein